MLTICGRAVNIVNPSFYGKVMHTCQKEHINRKKGRGSSLTVFSKGRERHQEGMLCADECVKEGKGLSCKENFPYDRFI